MQLVFKAAVILSFVLFSLFSSSLLTIAYTENLQFFQLLLFLLCA